MLGCPSITNDLESKYDRILQLLPDFIPSSVITQHTFVTKQIHLSSHFPVRTQNATYTICLLSLTNGLEQKIWVRGVFLLGRPHDSTTICFITVVPRIAE